MSFERRIAEALAPLPFELFPDFYDRNKTYKKGGKTLPPLDEWGAYNLVSERVGAYADDIDVADAITADVHYFTPSKSKAIEMRKRIRRALRLAGFVIQAQGLTYERDTEYYHARVEIFDLTETEE